MRITKVSIPRNHIFNGLEPVEMHRLGQIVLLAGKNGSGKSRLLQLITSIISQKPTKSRLKIAVEQKETMEKSVSKIKREIKNIEDTFKIYESVPSNDKRVIGYQKSIEEYNTNIKIQELTTNWNYIETDILAESYPIIPFIPKSLEIKDSNSLNRNVLKDSANKISSIGIQSLAEGTFAKIQIVQERYFNATHQNAKISNDEKIKAIEEYDKLKQLIRIFLDTELERNVDGDPTLFGFPLGQSNLSDGQKVLIQLCLAIHCQGSGLDRLILFMDEPENHLHPSVIIETIERLIKYIPNGQIWISTHSIPLLAAFNPADIWFMENGKVAYAGTIPENVLLSLLGSEEQVCKLFDFVSLPGVFALSRYAFESLFHPESIMTGKDDLQGLQIRNEIKEYIKESNKLRVLDYGSGKGRLLANIIENNNETKSDLMAKLDYIAYDKCDHDKIECISVLQQLYPNFEKRYFNEFNSLFSNYDKNSFDIVIMCNVLHEIDPKDWLKIFSEGGDIHSLLTDKGILLIVEDQEMFIGEKAYQKGFIVLDTPELKQLFNITEQEPHFKVESAKDGRIKKHVIARDYLTRISPESRIAALKSINKKASENIIEIRRQEINYKNGKRHGFWVQQLANSTLVLKELTN